MDPQNPRKKSSPVSPFLSSRIFEFAALRLPTDAAGDRLLCSIIEAFPSPLPSPDYSDRLAKLTLLRSLRSELYSPSERILDYLELIEVLDRPHRRKVEVSPSMAAAYVAVAVECAARHLRTGEGTGETAFRETVERVWGRRVGDLLKAGVGLASHDLKTWKWALTNTSKKPIKTNSVAWVDCKNEAVNAVQIYFEEAWKEMGTSFLEVAAEKWISKLPFNGNDEAVEKNEVTTNKDSSANAGTKTDAKFSLMDRNPTAHTYEWSEISTNSTSGKCPDAFEKTCLSDAKRSGISSLESLKDVNITKKARKPWNVEEEDALREAVIEFGAGNWKKILDCYGNKFAGRTPVNLKDKWRNMIREPANICRYA